MLCGRNVDVGLDTPLSGLWPDSGGPGFVAEVAQEQESQSHQQLKHSEHYVIQPTSRIEIYLVHLNEVFEYSHDIKMNDNEKERYLENCNSFFGIATHADLLEEERQLPVHPKHRVTQNADHTDFKYRSCNVQYLSCFR